MTEIERSAEVAHFITVEIPTGQSIDRRQFLVAAAAGVAGASITRQSDAQNRRDVTTLIVGFPPGGPVDQQAQLLAEQLRWFLTSSVVVDHRVGASGRIAVSAVIAAPPTGRTLLLTPGAMITLQPHLYQDLSYDPLTQLAPVALVAQSDFALVVAAEHPAGDVHALLRAFRQSPAEATCGTPGAGSVSHLVMTEIARAAGVEVTSVHYRGAQQQILALREGTLKAGIVVSAVAAPHVAAGTVRAVATTGLSRSPLLPTTPTLRESGIDVTGREWAGLFAPAGTPTATIDHLATATAKALAQAYASSEWKRTGFEPGGVITREFSAILKADSEHWARIIKRSGIKGDS